MIRQTMEWNTFCTEDQCATCRNRDTVAWREQVMAMSAAGTFLLSGLGAILLGSSLSVAIAVGLLSGGGALVLAEKLTRKRLKACDLL